jgi:hypothetical protein
VTREQWERLKVLFSGALDQPAERRHEWLTLHAQGDEMLAREAGALLLAHDTAGGFLEEPAVIDPADLAAVDELRAACASVPMRSSRRSAEAAWASCILPAICVSARVALKALPRLHDSNAALRERLRREARAPPTFAYGDRDGIRTRGSRWPPVHRI